MKPPAPSSANSITWFNPLTHSPDLKQNHNCSGRCASRQLPGSSKVKGCKCYRPGQFLNCEPSPDLWPNTDPQESRLYCRRKTSAPPLRTYMEYSPDTPGPQEGRIW